jgi:hypothetical protein
LGVGTTSPGSRLQLNSGAVDCSVRLRTTASGDSASDGVDLTLSTGNSFYITNRENGPTIFENNGSERARIDSSGNLQVNGGQFTVGVTATSGLQFINDGTFGTINSLPLMFRTGATERARIDSSGKMFIKTTSVPYSGSAAYLNVNSDLGSGLYTITSIVNSTASQGHLNFVNNNGNVGSITTSGSATSYVTSSDYRLKNSITPMTGALAKVAALKPVTYKWNADDSDGEGFIAHELAEVCPHAVTGEKDATRIEQYEISPAVPSTFDEAGNELTPSVEAVIGEREVPAYQGIDTSFLVATLTAAIQELNAKFEEYKAAHP